MSLYRRLLRIHRYLGLLVAVFALLLAVTGIALNHTERLALDQTLVRSPWLLKLYHIPEPQWRGGYQYQSWQAYQWQAQIYVNGQAIRDGQLRGFAANDQLLALLLSDQVLLLTHTLDVIDALPLPNPDIAHIGTLTDGRLALSRTKFAEPSVDNIPANQEPGWISDFDFSQWQPMALAPSEVTQATEFTEAQREASREQIESPGLPLERIILDLHSGRLFGALGVLWMDLVAVMMIALALTGLWIWWRRR